MNRPAYPGPGEAPRERTVIEGTGQPRQPAREPVERSGTVLETDDEVQQALDAHRRVVASPGPAPAPPPNAGRAANLFRPTIRPPVAVLTVFDDGKIDGETIRIRVPRFVIGRSEGDLKIPIDSRMSSRHVEITLQTVGGMHRWVVTDLQSTHGMFVRVSRTVLADKAEFIVGNGRYRFDAPTADPSETAPYVPTDGPFGETRGWDNGPGPFKPPALTELIGNEIGNRILLSRPDYWIGSDPTCAIGRQDDPFCELRHARIYRSTKGTWCAENNKSPNGLWLRMPQIVVDPMIQFQLGEQRFRLKVL